MAAKQGSGSINSLLAAAPHEAASDLDPKFEWIENATNYLLRLNLSGFKKDDFRVQVDSAGRLTVRGQRPADGKHAPPPRSSFHKVFQLPSAANLDDISGRFEASVLTLTVPKRKQPAPPTIIQEIKKPNAAKPKEEETSKALDEATRKAQHKEDAFKKPMDEATTKPQRKQDSSFNKAMDETTKKDQHKAEDEARTRKQQQEKKETQTPAVRREEVKPKAPEAAPAPANKPEVAGDKAKAVDRESLAERVKRRVEEAEQAKTAAAAAAAAAAEEAEREKKTASGDWKERVAGELEELTDKKWADGLVEMARNNKEVVAAAIAAFSLGFFVSQKLFSRK